MKSVYTDTENALLCDYFNVPRPPRLRGLSVYNETGGAYSFEDDDIPELELANAVARIALNGHEHKNGDAAPAAKTFRILGKHEVLIPRHLFTIRWVDQYLDLAWSESYYMTFFPGFERYVVSASHIPQELFDVGEVAIGWRNSGVPRMRIAEDIVTCGWADFHRHIFSKSWQSVEATGLITEDQAWTWRNKVWRFLLN